MNNRQRLTHAACLLNAARHLLNTVHNSKERDELIELEPGTIEPAHKIAYDAIDHVDAAQWSLRHFTP